MRFGMIGNPLRLRLYGPCDSNVKGIGAYYGQIERIFTHYLGAQPATGPDLERPTKLTAESRCRLGHSTDPVRTEFAEDKTFHLHFSAAPVISAFKLWVLRPFSVSFYFTQG